MVTHSARKKSKAKRAAKVGRPSSYRPEFEKQARKLGLLGATDVEVAAFFEVSEVTVNAWKKAHPEFLKSLNSGKDAANANVADKLYRRALGYSHKAVKIVTVAQGKNQGSVVEVVPYTERYPPDTTAAIFWLKNREPVKWRDKQDHEITGKNGGPVELEVRTEELRTKLTNRISGLASRIAPLAPATPDGNGTNDKNGRHA
jgi:hypothetical protein